MRVTKAEVFSVIQRARVQKRWDKTTPEQRYQHSQRMNEAKAAKAAERGVVLGEPRLPDTRIAQITKAKPAFVAGAACLPTVLEVFGAPVAQLARERVNQQSDAADLGYDEREYRENIERRKLCIEYYERTGQFDKATLWEAQLGKSLERHQRASAPVIRKKLEAEYRELSYKLGNVMEAEVAEMTDEELRRLEAGDGGECSKDVSEMSIAELKEGIEWMKADVAEYAARPRPSLRSASVEVPIRTPIVEPEIEPRGQR